MGELNLYYPQWQGSGTQKTLYLGAAAARKGLNLKSRMEEVKLSGAKLDTENGIQGSRALLEQMKTVKGMIEERKPGSIFTLGGGSDVSAVPVSYINKLAEGNLSVLWLSSHPDLKTPEAAEGKLQNMALRTLLENDFPEMDALYDKKLDPSQVVILGGQSATDEEKAYIEEKGIRYIPAENLIWNDPKSWIKDLKDHVFICVNFDIFEPEAFPHAYRKTEHGMQIEQLSNLLKVLDEERNIAGFTLAEYGSTDPDPLEKEEFKTIVATGLWI